MVDFLGEGWQQNGDFSATLMENTGSHRITAKPGIA
jgi:hypothetical protein